MVSASPTPRLGSIVQASSVRRAELAEIDENLVRTDLTTAQEAVAVARRKAIYLKLHPETKVGVNQHTRGSEKTSEAGFAEATAKATGKTSRTVRTAAARGKALGADAIEIVGTSLDKGVEIDALVKLAPAERADKVKRALYLPIAHRRFLRRWPTLQRSD